MITNTKKKQEGLKMDREIRRRLPIGADVLPGNGTDFRVWAPLRKKVEVVIEGSVFNRDHGGCAAVELQPEGGGYFSGMVPAAAGGTLYRYRLDGGDLFPDPASRFQPLGPHGPSQVIDPSGFQWTDRDWPGISIPGQIIYEMHIGTFTPEGTWKAAAALLPSRLSPASLCSKSCR
jgi:maltooligosyltrehalose trehalohydrolase